MTRISIDNSGRLVIDLKTQAKFRGQFVLQHPAMENEASSLIAPEDMDIKFDLELLWTSSTWDGPEQVHNKIHIQLLPFNLVRFYVKISNFDLK